MRLDKNDNVVKYPSIEIFWNEMKICTNGNEFPMFIFIFLWPCGVSAFIFLPLSYDKKHMMICKTK
jgi:hypothetical protein